MDEKTAREYARSIEAATGLKNPRPSEEIAALFESGKRDQLDILELSQYSLWLAQSGEFARAEQIASAISDAVIQKQTLAEIARRMIEHGALERAEFLLDLISEKAPDAQWTLPNELRVHLAEAYSKQGNTQLATSILTKVEQLIGREGRTDYEQADDLFVLANGWLTVGDRSHAKQLYIQAFTCAERSFEITRAAGGNGFDEGQLSAAIIRRLMHSGELHEASRLASLIGSEHWREEARRLVEGLDSV